VSRRRFQPREPDELPSLEDARAALSSKKDCERVFGPLRRDDIIDTFKRYVEMGISEQASAATISHDPETGGEEQVVSEQSVVVPIWMLAQAAVLLGTARPGHKQSMPWKEQRIRLAAKYHYQQMMKRHGRSAEEAAKEISHWLRERGIYLSKESILKGSLSRRPKRRE
jgi:hypothetical protein